MLLNCAHAFSTHHDRIRQPSGQFVRNVLPDRVNRHQQLNQDLRHLPQESQSQTNGPIREHRLLLFGQEMNSLQALLSTSYQTSYQNSTTLWSVELESSG